MDDARRLERLVACYSPSGRERRAVGEFVRSARELGYRTSVDAAGNGVAVRGRGRPELLFLGHIDTVEGRRPVRRRAGRIHGRGVVDAKGALIAALLAGRDRTGPGTLRIAAAVGEETDSRGARHLLRGRRPDGLLAGEPSGWDGLTVGYKGVYRFAATFRARRAHYSGPSSTATDAAVAWAGALRRWAEARTVDSRFRSPTVHLIGCSSGPPGDDDVVRLTVDLRLPPGLGVAAAKAALPESSPRPTVRELARAEPLDLSPTNPVAAALVAGIRAQGHRPTLWRKSGTSDLNLAAPAWGLPGAAYGPGDARLDHTARESLSIRELERSVAVLRTAFDRLLGADGRPPTLPRSAAAA